MNVLYILIPLALLLLVGAVWAFFWAGCCWRPDGVAEPNHQGMGSPS